MRRRRERFYLNTNGCLVLIGAFAFILLAWWIVAKALSEMVS